MKVLPRLSLLAFSATSLACKVDVNPIESPPADTHWDELGCRTNAECIDANGGKPFVCNKSTRACVLLQTDACTPYVAADDIRDDNTIWLGVVYPSAASGGDTSRVNAAELARREIMAANGGLPATRSSGGRARPLGLLVCDENAPTASTVSILHDVQVPAIVGYTESTNFITAASDAVADQVLLMGAGPSSPLLTAIDGGAPRLVYRTTTNDAEVVLALAKAVSASEAAVRARRGAVDGTLRLAILHPSDATSTALGEIVDQNATINGLPLSRADGAAIHFGYDEKDASGNADLTRALEDFKPDIVLTFGGPQNGETLAKILAPLDAAAAPGLEPLYLTNAAPRSWLIGALKHVVYVDLDYSRTALQQFFPKLVATFPTALPPSDSVAASTYDAVYAIAMAIAANGDNPVTGPNLSNALPRLTTGPLISAGPASLADAFSTLPQGTIDLDGITGPLDFQQSTPDVHTDLLFTCAGSDASNGAFFRYASSTIEGQIACP